MDRDYYTFEQAHERFGVSKTRACKLIAEGKIKASKLGKRTLIIGDSIKTFMASLPAAELSAPGPRRAA